MMKDREAQHATVYGVTAESRQPVTENEQSIRTAVMELNPCIAPRFPLGDFAVELAKHGKDLEESHLSQSL